MPTSRELPPRDLLFISHASEDNALTEWLALKLTAEGYKVWVDLFDLLGGESYPEDIDQIIKERTFRMLALLSRHSIHKPDPHGERTLALQLQRDRGKELFIPLNVDGLAAADLDWRTIDITFISFANDWAGGLAQLLEKLEEVGAPKDVVSGRAIAASVFLSDEVLTEKAEPLYTNLLTFERIPEVVYCYRCLRRLGSLERDTLSDVWAHWAHSEQFGRTRYFSFWPPPQEHPKLGELSWVLAQAGRWRDAHEFQGMTPDHVVKPLLRRTILHHLRRKGLRHTGDPTVLYFPTGLLEGDWLPFTDPSGARRRFAVVGERAFPNSDRFRYHLAVTFDVLRSLSPEFVAKFRIRLHVTDMDGEPLPAVSANARRKYVTKDWWNDKWLHRQLGVAEYMAGGKNQIVIGDEDPLVLSARLPQLEAPRGIDESKIPAGVPRFAWTHMDTEEPEDEEDDGEEEEDGEGRV